MEPSKENVAPGQQNYPTGNPDEDNKLAHPEEEITRGARQEDQLDKMKEAAPEGDEGKEHGAEPNVYQYKRQETNDSDE
ncbi:hypothetical protein EOD41_12585 [Mucilaginibacter limnophilus]|uniref:Uncharacterized protein n=1 Tax=Mucilaginibacter limnophilus TaxID=1932778 RepID=A0A3S2VLT9_9SPHI|nr:hypothetical protein [Mucilaginibacter limnophilus]RVU00314.1 hypothetical protein EOD41_12585 [Mucilaginibacter limnophilus]